MSADVIAALATFGGIWLCGVGFYIYGWVKTRTKPFELSDDELVKRVFGDKEKDELNGNDNNPSV